jgi:hypothetical protein
MTTVAPGDAITGGALAEAMVRLQDPDGNAISFSGADLSFISNARNALVVANGSVDLRGTTGSLDWDAVGDIRTDVLGWDLADQDPDPDVVNAILDNTRIYLLNEGENDGMWVDL